LELRHAGQRIDDLHSAAQCSNTGKDVVDHRAEKGFAELRLLGSATVTSLHLDAGPFSGASFQTTKINN